MFFELTTFRPVLSIGYMTSIKYPGRLSANDLQHFANIPFGCDNDKWDLIPLVIDTFSAIVGKL
jgi:hypothetical protein